MMKFLSRSTPDELTVISDKSPVPLGIKSIILLIVASLGGLMMFAWPFFTPAQVDGNSHQTTAPFAFVIILPILLLLVLAQMAENGLDVKPLAILGVLSAINAGLRPLDAGTNGIELVFFLLILAGRVFGPGFGFLLGCLSLFASALLTAGIGPWLPFQMLSSAWVGMGAGLLPQNFGLPGHKKTPIRGTTELLMLIGYGIIAAYLYGLIMNLWFWPFISGSTMGDMAGLAYIPGGPLLTNLQHFLIYTLLTSTAVWDTGRAVTNTIMLGLLGLPVLALLRRTVRRANFAPLVEFKGARAKRG